MNDTHPQILAESLLRLLAKIKCRFPVESGHVFKKKEKKNQIPTWTNPSKRAELQRQREKSLNYSKSSLNVLDSSWKLRL